MAQPPACRLGDPARGRLGARRGAGHGRRHGRQPAFQRRPWRGPDPSRPSTNSTPRSWTAPRWRPARSAPCAARATRSRPRGAVLIAGVPCCWPASPPTPSPNCRGWRWCPTPVLDHAAAHRRLALAAAEGGTGSFIPASRPRNTAPSAPWRATPTAIWRRPRRPAASTTSPTAGSATAPSSAPAPMPATACARCRAPARARSSSAACGLRHRGADAIAGEKLEAAAHTVVFETLASHKIGAGLVALGAEGNPVAPYNTLGMYRGWITTDGQLVVATPRTCTRWGAIRRWAMAQTGFRRRTDPDLGRRRHRRHPGRLLGARRHSGADGRHRRRACRGLPHDAG